ncbi:MAG: DUF2961 domain-containing protein [Proteiniphilum sp.]|nr:DUF2961 domain-containing protein [Proteiniphilum sp.]MDD4415505.1 DUF2961 domain-containing protein [Proteiniphilum sp.]
MNPTIKKTGILIFSLAISLNIVYSQKISLESLLLEMTNRKTLAEYPSPGYFCKQFSSYDRASVESNQKSWFANWDRNMFIRTETGHGRKEYVLMDAKGPGAIVRMWMTFSGENSGRGVLRIYLDDYSTPVIEGDGSPFDINYVNLKGRGVYVGDCLTLFNTVYAWWGEGDEKIYVDGETFPSHFGTGTEDYYGYAWCRPEPFTDHPFIAQSDGSGNFDPGYTHNLRFRSLDAIPFRKSLKFDMEMWHWTKAVIHFSPITFWYINPQDAKSIPSSNLSDATLKVAMKREDIISPSIIDNKVEAENMILEKITGGNFRYSNNIKKGWSNNIQVLWSDMRQADLLSLSFILNKKMNADVVIRFSKGPRYGTFKVSVNKQMHRVIEPFYKQDTIGVEIVRNLDINKGKNLLQIEYLEHENYDGTKYQVGMDCIEFFNH